MGNFTKFTMLKSHELLPNHENLKRQNIST